MSPVMVEFPLSEAEGILTRLSADGERSMSAADCANAESGRQRLARAVAVEVGSGGSEEQSIEEIAESLIGQRVRVQTTYGSVKTGILRRLSGFRTAMIEESERINHPVNLSLVTSIEAEKAAA